jgi:hypothetical protein
MIHVDRRGYERGYPYRVDFDRGCVMQISTRQALIATVALIAAGVIATLAIPKPATVVPGPPQQAAGVSPTPSPMPT